MYLGNDDANQRCKPSFLSLSLNAVKSQMSAAVMLGTQSPVPHLLPLLLHKVAASATQNLAKHSLG